MSTWRDSLIELGKNFLSAMIGAAVAFLSKTVKPPQKKKGK